MGNVKSGDLSVMGMLVLAISGERMKLDRYLSVEDFGGSSDLFGVTGE